jgi:hypothetical protein
LGKNKKRGMVAGRPVLPQRLVTFVLEAMSDDGSYASLIDTRVNKLDMREELRPGIGPHNRRLLGR